MHKTSPGVANVFRPSIIFRLAEFYLLYAEALNETDPSNPDILKYVNLIRERAGIPNLQVLNSAIAGNQELQRLAIQRESRIELATEGQRYFDVRRWMIAEKEEARQGGDFYGMDMAGDYANFFKRTKFETRVFNEKMYLYPIPFTEIQKSKNLVQNPGW
ncbi:SusD family protein [compost metagenome]